MRSGLFWLAVWTVLSVASLIVRGQSKARLTGTIEDQASAPITGVTITLISLNRVLRTESVANGSFEFDDIPMGAYEIEISAPGFARQKLSINLQENTASPPLSIVLRIGNMPDMETCGPHSSVKYGPQGSTNPHLAGIIRDFYRHKPVVNAEVTVWRTGDHQAAFRCNSDQAGRFTLEKIPADYYDLRISRRGYWPAEIKQLVIPRANTVCIDATVLQRSKIVVCQ